MSFAPKANRPDSKDTAKLRKEYDEKVRQFKETSDPATRAKLKDDKEKAFKRVVDQQSAERRENLAQQQKVLASLGRFKTHEQIAKEQAEAAAKSQPRTMKA